MTFRTAVSVGALVAALAIPLQATAQTQPAPAPAPAAKAPVAGQILTQEQNSILASKELIGQTVYAPDKSKIGSISDLLLSQDGKTVTGFVIGVGGFLGIGEKSVALGIDRLKINHGAEGPQLAMDVTKDELANAPAFKSRKDIEAERRAEQRRNEPPRTPTRPN